MRLIFASILFSIVTIGLHAQEDAAVNTDHAVVGEVVPDFMLAILDNTSQDVSLYDLDNEVIILDFWATWCGPCITGLPKMEALEKKFAGKVKVLAITDEKEDRIRSFISAHNYDLTYVLDTSRVLNDYFEHRTVPHYVVLNQEKKVVAVTHGEYLTEENIQGVIDGESIDVPLKKDVMNFEPDMSLSDNRGVNIFQSILSPYKPGNPTMSQVNNNGDLAGRRIFISNLTAPAFIPIAYQYSRSRIIEEFEDPSRFDFDNKANRFCYELIVPEERKDQIFEIMQEEITRLFDLQVEHTRKTVPVWVLKRDPSSDVVLKESTSESRPEKFIRYGEGVTLVNEKISELSSFLEVLKNQPVLDETNLIGQYDIKIQVIYGKPELTDQDLAKYGLVLEKEEREIEVLLVKG